MTASLDDVRARHRAPLDGPPILLASGFTHEPATRPGERLHEVFEEQVDWVREHLGPGHLAVDAGELTLTFAELDQAANQLARYLIAAGAQAGDRIGLLFDEPVYSYVGMLAVSKINAAYLPLDVGFPPDRIGYILSDAQARLVLTLSHVPERVEGLAELAERLVFCDRDAAQIAALDPSRLTETERDAPVDDLAYLIYTSGTTGRPKGVAISHASICNFVRVAAAVYGIRPDDRIYQGMTIAFDFSIEEIWVPWMSGATVVPKPAGPSLLGADLHHFLTEAHITAMCVVPTLLATIDEDLPELRFLLVSGEACPQDLINRWHHPNRRFLNVYGPTEATVTATWTTLHPDRPVTIGEPLPSYAVVILDPDNPHQVLPFGQVGEIGLAGIGLAEGYLGREDLTNKAFIDDFIGIPANPSGRIYRTGDLGRINECGQIEYHGRIDLQVKVRGYRIELTEIESVLLEVPGVAAAVVDTYKPTPSTLELVGYYSLRTDVDTLDPEPIYQHLRDRLPGYMVPAYLQHLARIPMTNSDKADRKALPPPTTGRRHATNTAEHIPPANDTETLLADALATTLGLDRVSVESHFFDDLAGNSLIMAQFSARVRKHNALPAISMRQIYQHPTIRQLADALGPARPHATDPATIDAGDGAPAEAEAAGPGGIVGRVRTARYLFCGALQLVTLLLLVYVSAYVTSHSFLWAGAGATPLADFERAGLFTVALFIAACLLPIAAKWTIIGRFKPREIPVWSLTYFRFWLVKTLITVNPLVLFVGTPIYNLYLRALGAKIGPGTTILSTAVPVATDLITIGADALIRQDASFAGYQATNTPTGPVLRTGPVALGNQVFVGATSVLDINTSIEDGGQLGHSSSLHPGQRIPTRQSWHGVPAEPTTTNYQTVPPASRGTLRRAIYALFQLFAVIIGGAALSGVVVMLLTGISSVDGFFDPTQYSLASIRFYATIATIAAILFLGGLILRLAAMVAVPRLLSLFLRPGVTYPLYGLRYLFDVAITRLTNSPFFIVMFGDSSAAVGYARALGYDLSVVEQTGSNFGTEIRQDNPLHTTVGTGTMLSDGLSIMNTDFSASSFRVHHVAIGARSFLGNNIAYPAGAKLGDNVLLGTRVMVPIDGPIRENTGLLGSPPFEIPRSVARDTRFDYLKTPRILRQRLAAKLRHNIASMAVFLLSRYLGFYAMLLLTIMGSHFYDQIGALATTGSVVAIVVFQILFSSFLERAVMGFRPLIPRFVSIYDSYFWRHERLWKVLAVPYFNGTPFKALHWRLLGVRYGRRIFDDGCGIPEKTLVAIGDDAVLNNRSVIQCHSLEDGTFKSDRTTIGSGSVLGVGAFVHYGVAMGPGTFLGTNAFLMKGEQTMPFTHWGGNPATEVSPAIADRRILQLVR